MWMEVKRVVPDQAQAGRMIASSKFQPSPGDEGTEDVPAQGQFTPLGAQNYRPDLAPPFRPAGAWKTMGRWSALGGLLGRLCLRGEVDSAGRSVVLEDDDSVAGEPLTTSLHRLRRRRPVRRSTAAAPTRTPDPGRWSLGDQKRDGLAPHRWSHQRAVGIVRAPGRGRGPAEAPTTWDGATSHQGLTCSGG